jgi:hypothetical protein
MGFLEPSQKISFMVVSVPAAQPIKSYKQQNLMDFLQNLAPFTIKKAFRHNLSQEIAGPVASPFSAHRAPLAPSQRKDLGCPGGWDAHSLLHAAYAISPVIIIVFKGMTSWRNSVSLAQSTQLLPVWRSFSSFSPLASALLCAPPMSVSWHN